MKRFKLTTRTSILLALLAVVAASWIHITVYTWNLERSLMVIAEAKMLELNTHYKAQPLQVRDFHLAPQVTAAREYLIFGPTHGKVHLLLRVTSPKGEERFGAFDYFFNRNGGTWVQTDSGYCGETVTQEEAQAVFASLDSR